MNDIPSEQKSGQPTLLDMYKIHIEYIRHENELLHQRVTWFVAIQGGALAALSFSMQKYFESFLKFSAMPDVGALSVDERVSQFLVWAQFVGYWMLICWLGWVAARKAKISIKAALQAQKRVELNWARRFLDRADVVGFPALMGGGEDQASADGGAYAKHLPGIFTWIWPTIWLGTLVGSCPWILNFLRHWELIKNLVCWLPN